MEKTTIVTETRTRPTPTADPNGAVLEFGKLACTPGGCVDLWTITALAFIPRPFALTVEAFVPAANPVCPPSPAVFDCGGPPVCAVGGTAVINGPCP